MRINRIFAVLVFAVGAQPLAAADFSDPTWPCIQRKVVDLSIGQMFPFVIPEREGEDAALDRDIEALSQRLSLRRFPVEELLPLIDEFATQHQSNAALGALFTTTFETISKQRKTIISGIARYAGKQSSLSEQIEAQRAEMNAQLDKSEPDFDRVDEIEERLDWDERIYQDRVRALTYVCESPVLLEKRAFAIARAIQNHWKQ